MDPELFAIFGSSFVLGLSGALFPGPLVTLAIRESVYRGVVAGPILALGHAIVELIIVLLLAFGMSQALDRGPLTAAIGLIGGLFLLLIAYQVIQGSRTQTLELGGVTGVAGGSHGWGSGFGRLVPAGAAVSVSNPYLIIWWATVGAAAVTRSLDAGGAGVASFYAGHISSDFLWLTFVAFVLATGRRVMSRRVYRGILAACGLFLAVLGLYFIGSAVTFVT